MEQVVNNTNEVTKEAINNLSDFKYAERLLPILDSYKGLYEHADKMHCKTIFDALRNRTLYQAYKCLYAYIREVLGLNTVRNLVNVQQEFDSLIKELDTLLQLQLEQEDELFVLNSEDGRLIETLIETPGFQLESFEQAAQFIQPIYEFIRYCTLEAQRVL